MTWQTTDGNALGEGRLLSIPECAAMCGVSAQTVRRWVLSGRLKACKLGPGRSAPLRIRPEDLDAFVNPVLPSIRRAVPPPWTRE